jgi:endonuclease/exonuclease/phosphatase family metal-dependent hydrolase
VRLASADQPDVLFLQEVPVWGLSKLGEWSGMSAFVAPAARPKIGPLAKYKRIGRPVSLRASPNSRTGQLLRLGIVGDANVTLLSTRLRVVDRRVSHLNPTSLRRRHSRACGLGWADRLKWAKERRVCLSLVVELERGDRAVVSNLHTTAYPERVAELELERAAAMSDELALPDDIQILAGDFNVYADSSKVLSDLTTARNFSSAGPSIDHILVRGIASGIPETWSDERRRVDGRLLSDHAPVDLRLA